MLEAVKGNSEPSELSEPGLGDPSGIVFTRNILG